MGQSKIESFIETVVNTVIGILVSFLVWPIAAFITGVEYNTSQHIGIIIIFTIASVARGYVVRRFFNHRLMTFYKKIATKFD